MKALPAIIIAMLFLAGCCEDEEHIHLFHTWTKWGPTQHNGRCHSQERVCLRCDKVHRRTTCD